MVQEVLPRGDLFRALSEDTGRELGWHGRCVLMSISPMFKRVHRLLLRSLTDEAGVRVVRLPHSQMHWCCA